MPRMPLSAETAQKLALFMKVPLEHLMHMPQHIMIQKLGEMAKAQTDENTSDESEKGEKGT